MPNITVQWYAGRTDQQKREITAAITDASITLSPSSPCTRMSLSTTAIAWLPIMQVQLAW